MGRAKRSLGQNFLLDANLQRKIVAALGAGPDDEVLEIGPGRGALTRHLVGQVGRLVLVELDDDLAASLALEYGDRPDVDVVHGDVLEVSVTERVDDPERLLVIGNIPYNITTPIIFRLLARPRPRSIVLMVQDEVPGRDEGLRCPLHRGAQHRPCRAPVQGTERGFSAGARRGLGHHSHHSPAA